MYASELENSLGLLPLLTLSVPAGQNMAIWYLLKDSSDNEQTGAPKLKPRKMSRKDMEGAVTAYYSDDEGEFYSKKPSAKKKAKQMGGVHLFQH